ncbi:MAG: iron-sulfur cluster insertion protein ErpA [Candidatus Dormibacteraceae bacterium]
MIEQTTIEMTDAAVKQLQALLEKENNPELGLRVWVTGGGCTGLQYGMAFDDKVGGEDTVIEQNGVRVLVDQETLRYVDGSTIDYVDGLMGAGFTVQNPNAARSCSCGHSFSTGEDEGTAKPCGCG